MELLFNRRCRKQTEVLKFMILTSNFNRFDAAPGC